MKFRALSLIAIFATACGDGRDAREIEMPPAAQRPTPDLTPTGGVATNVSERFVSDVAITNPPSEALVSCLCDRLYDARVVRTELRCEIVPLRELDSYTLQLKIVMRDRLTSRLADSHVVYLEAERAGDGWGGDSVRYTTANLERYALVVTQSDETLYRQIDLAPCAKELISQD